MAINIKNDQTVMAVKRLAERYDTTYTKAIELAAEVALSTPSASAEQEALQQVMQIAAAYRKLLPSTMALEADALYDQDGLYR